MISYVKDRKPSMKYQAEFRGMIKTVEEKYLKYYVKVIEVNPKVLPLHVLSATTS